LRAAATSQIAVSILFRTTSANLAFTSIFLSEITRRFEMFWMRSRATPAAAEALRRDPVLIELQHDVAVTRTMLLTVSLVGLVILVGLWWRRVLPNGYTVFFWALACFAVGALLGFLFGIPRVLQKDSKPDGAQSPPTR
jgi:hypothetical protein